jgi:hypothetical protein
MIQLRPIGSYLTKFDDKQAAAEIFAPAPSFDAASAGFGAIAGTFEDERPDPAPDERENLRENLREELRAEIERAFEEKLEDERKAFEDEREAFAQRLETERAAWVQEEGARIAESLHREIDGCLENLRCALARMLTPFLTHRALEQSLEDFLHVVRSAVADQENPLVELHGPADLLDIMREKLSHEQISIRAVESDAADISAQVNGALIETRMEEWVRRLRNGE